MQIGSLNSNYSSKVSYPSSINFKSEIGIDTTLKTDKFAKSQQEPEKPKSSLVKKIGAGIASALYPGLGQLTNGQFIKATGFAIGEPLLIIAAYIAGGPLAACATYSLFQIWNISDAVKNA